MSMEEHKILAVIIATPAIVLDEVVHMVQLVIADEKAVLSGAEIDPEGDING
jgi:hypothetical protein